MLLTKKSKKRLFPAIIALLSVLILMLNSVQHSGAASSDSFSLQGQIKDGKKSASSAYSLCSRLTEVVTEGGSNSFNLESTMDCDVLTVSAAIVCGNGILEIGEDCDDANLISGDGCNASCQIEGALPPPVAVCGNGLLEGSEECDDGNLISGDGCNTICIMEITSGGGGGSTPGVICGNSIRETGEQCDDGNNISGDGCTSNCLLEVFSGGGGSPTVECGNGQVELGEDCDDGNNLSGDGCSSSCIWETVYHGSPVPAICGNNILESGEYCDDGNLVSGDGCDSNCEVEIVLLNEPVVPKVETPKEKVIVPICGNGIVEQFEDCDDGNNESGDGCSELCILEEYQPKEDFPPICGNGVIEQFEDCDDGNNESGDGCSEYCFRELEPDVLTPASILQEPGGSGLITYLTNDVTPHFYEQFFHGTDNFRARLIRQKDNYLVTELEVEDGYFAIESNEDLQDGYYTVEVWDEDEPQWRRLMILEVRKRRQIEAPLVKNFDQQDLNKSDLERVLQVNNSYPVIRGKVPMKAVVGVYSQLLDRMFIAYPDDQGTYEFTYPKVLNSEEVENLSLVALYENGYLSRERILSFQMSSIEESLAATLYGSVDEQDLFWVYLFFMVVSGFFIVYYSLQLIKKPIKNKKK